MKKVILSVAVLATLSTSGMAQDFVAENENILIRAGMNIDNSYDNVVEIQPGNIYAGNEGGSKDSGYELSIGIEEQVADYKFGSRKFLTLYNHGDSEAHLGNLTTEVGNAGLEGTYEVYYKVTKYFKPSIGLGLGINRQTVNLQERSGISDNNLYDRDTVNYLPTVHAVIGISGEAIVGIGWYANYKYRLADTSTTLVPYDDGVNGRENTTIQIDGVNGGVITAGLSYQF